MSKTSTCVPSIPGGTTPFPNHLIALMPHLSDTEWRLICFIVRQTLGWSKNGARKKQDWLSHSQLKAGTGRASAAICKALDSLVQKGLVEVTDSEGHILSSPHQRRRSVSRLFFRIINLPPGAEPGSKTEMPFSQSEIHKAKTTKETHTKRISKEIENPGEDLPHPSGENRMSKGWTPVDNPVDNSQLKQFLDLYQQLFKLHSARGELPILSWGKDARLVRQLLNTFAYERLAELLEQFFGSSEHWIHRSGYSLGAFRSAINSLLISDTKSAEPIIHQRSHGWNRVERSQTHLHPNSLNGSYRGT